MMASFNVLSEPWVPVVALEDDETREVGLLEAVAGAHTLREIRDPSPMIQFGLYRLLIAFVTDACRLHDLDDLRDLLDEGRFDTGLLRDYVDACGPVFDLFDEQRPWCQSPVSPGQTKPIAELLQHLPSGSSATHFHHGAADDHGWSPAVCARALAAIPPFMTAGGAGLSPSINGIPPWYMLCMGKNLFQTLLLNVPVMVPDVMRSEDDRPAWRSSDPVQPRQEVKTFSRLAGLTWRPRTIRLVPSEGGECTYCGEQVGTLVRAMIFTAGFKAAGEPGTWQDPNVAYRWSNEEPTPLRPREERMLWRDLGPLVLLRRPVYTSQDGKIRFERPAVVSQYHELVREGAVPEDARLSIEAYGLRTDGKMKIFEWQVERLTLPAALLQNPLAAVTVQWACEQADDALYLLRQCLKLAYPREGKRNAHAMETQIREAQHDLQHRLRFRLDDVLLDPLIRTGPEVPDDAAIRRHWVDVLLREAEQVLEQVLDALDADADALQRQVHARDRFGRRAAAMRHALESLPREPQSTTK